MLQCGCFCVDATVWMLLCGCYCVSSPWCSCVQKTSGSVTSRTACATGTSALCPHSSGSGPVRPTSPPAWSLWWDPAGITPATPQQVGQHFQNLHRGCLPARPLVGFHRRSAHSGDNKEPLGVISGHFLYVTVPEGGLTQDWAAFQSPRLEPTNSTHPCKVSLDFILVKSSLLHRLKKK